MRTNLILKSRLGEREQGKVQGRAVLLKKSYPHKYNVDSVEYYNNMGADILAEENQFTVVTLLSYESWSRSHLHFSQIRHGSRMTLVPSLPTLAFMAAKPFDLVRQEDGTSANTN